MIFTVWLDHALTLALQYTNFNSFHAISGVTNIRVRLGVTDVNNPENEQEAQSKASRHHPDFGGGDRTQNYTYDVMLIQLDTEVTLTEFIQTACLPGSITDFLDGEKCIVSGWGDTTNVEPKEPSERLKYTLIELQSWEECNSTELNNAKYVAG